MGKKSVFLLVIGGLAGAPSPARPQDANVFLPVDSIERLLGVSDFVILNRTDTRFEGDRTQRVTLKYGEQDIVRAKWAMAARGGDTFNNSPRYELAAYELQKLFLDPQDFVVPVTVARTFPLDWYRGLDSSARETFGRTESVLVVLQYWLFNVTADNVFDEERLKSDSIYARHLANLNIFSYLIKHSDSNKGNILISTDPTNPRLFSVDNGVAFRSEESDRGKLWRRLRVDRLPAETVDRLREIQYEDLERALAVCVQYEVRNAQLIRSDPGENLEKRRGVRTKDDIIQLGLTDREINDVFKRLEWLLKQVDEGKIEVF